MCGIAPQCDEKNVIGKNNGDKRCIVKEGGSHENEMNEGMVYWSIRRAISELNWLRHKNYFI